MKRYLFMLTLAIAAGMFCLTSDASAQRGGSKGVDHGRFGVSQGRWQGHHLRGQNNGEHRYRGRNRNTYGYKNYGQYRRTQVGNRRYSIRDYWKRRHF